MVVTSAQIAESWNAPLMRAENWAPSLNDSMEAFDINTPDRQAAFLAQIGHESGGGRFVREIWGPTDAQRRYEGRADLGNTTMGDGFKYRGRGLIQTTGRANYRATTDGLRAGQPDAPDFEAVPEALEIPKWAALSAGWFWDNHGLNEMADVGEFMRITRKINGGLNGYDARMQLWQGAKRALGVV